MTYLNFSLTPPLTRIYEKGKSEKKKKANKKKTHQLQIKFHNEQLISNMNFTYCSGHSRPSDCQDLQDGLEALS